jgi:UDP-2-acetamido-2,6-beta-L-arabino-hexul-4-ose reductase
LPRHGDERGVFVEMLKTQDSGQFSFFHRASRHYAWRPLPPYQDREVPGPQGFGAFRLPPYRDQRALRGVHLGDKPQVVETVPGWTHDITNVGEDEMVVMLWANEIFDRDRPDTIASKV